jgi:hypothetical protein
MSGGGMYDAAARQYPSEAAITTREIETVIRNSAFFALLHLTELELSFPESTGESRVDLYFIAEQKRMQNEKISNDDHGE